jgi:hypothetical protein
MESKARKNLENLLWKNTHRDFRGSIDGEKNVLVLRPEGTCLVSISSLTDEELLDKMPKRICFCVMSKDVGSFKKVVGWTVGDVKFYYLHDSIAHKTIGPSLDKESLLGTV